MKPLNQLLKDKAVDMYRQGYNGMEISKELGISKTVVYEEMKRQGVNARDTRTSKVIKKCPKCGNKNGLGKVSTISNKRLAAGLFCSICLSEIIKNRGKIEILKPQSS